MKAIAVICYDLDDFNFWLTSNDIKYRIGDLKGSILRDNVRFVAVHNELNLRGYRFAEAFETDKSKLSDKYWNIKAIIKNNIVPCCRISSTAFDGNEYFTIQDM